MHRCAEGQETDRMPPVSAAKTAVCQSGAVFALTTVVALTPVVAGTLADGSTVVVTPAGGGTVVVWGAVVVGRKGAATWAVVDEAAGFG
jgi:hypothetical protein